jgi:hypothetical protein
MPQNGNSRIDLQDRHARDLDRSMAAAPSIGGGDMSVIAARPHR